jgi:hypothetical protein
MGSVNAACPAGRGATWYVSAQTAGCLRYTLEPVPQTIGWDSIRLRSMRQRWLPHLELLRHKGEEKWT